MRIAVLGPMAASQGDQRIELPGRKERTLLAVLVAHRGRSVDATDLAAAVWPAGRPPSWRTSLSVFVSRLRATFKESGGRPGITRVGGGWSLDASVDDVDAWAFEERANGASKALTDGRFVESQGLSALALGLWRGRPFTGFEDIGPCTLAASRLEALHATLEEIALSAELALGRGPELVLQARSLVDEDPLREQRWSLLMLAAYRAGRQADALAYFAEARNLLRRELGVAPGLELTRRQTEVLTHDPGLFSPLLRPPVTVAKVSPRNPYPGLDAYAVESSTMFFGRERFVATVARKLATQGIVTIAGVSGSGKSSVIRAGLVPAVRSGALPGSERWPVGITHPGAASGLPGPWPKGGGVLVIDRLEEIFTQLDADARLTLSAELTQRRASGDRLVLAIRSDFWSVCATEPALHRLVGESTVLLGPPSDDDVRRVVTQPALLSGRTVDAALVDAVIEDVAGRDGMLPWLSTALARTWDRASGDRLSVADYQACGAIAESITRMAEEVYAALSREQQAAAAAIFPRLATDTSHGVARRTVALDQLATLAPEAAGTVDLLLSARLLVMRQEGCEVVHESLFTAWPRCVAWLSRDAAGRRIRERLTPSALAWAESGRASSDLFSGVRLAEVVAWRESEEPVLSDIEGEFVDASVDYADRARREAIERAADEARTARRLRRLLFATATLLVLAITATGVALEARDRATAYETRAIARQLGSQALVEGRTDLALLLATAAVRLDPRPDTVGDLFATVMRTPEAIRVAHEDARWYGLDISPDGRTLALTSNRGLVELRDATTLSIRSKPVPPTGINTTGVSYIGPDADLATVMQDMDKPVGAHVVIRDQRTGRVSANLPMADGYVAWATGDGSRIVASAYFASYLWIRDDSSWRGVRVGGQEETATNPSGKGRMFAVVSPTGTSLRSTADGRVLRRLPTVKGAGPHAALSADGRRLVTIDPASRDVVVWDTVHGSRLRGLPGQGVDPSDMRISPDDSIVAVAFGNGILRAWDLATGELRTDVRAARENLKAVVTPDGRRVVTAGVDGTVAVWDLSGQASLGPRFRIPNATAALAWPGATAGVIAVSPTGELSRVDPATSTVTARLTLGAPARTLASDPRGELVAAATDKGIDLVAVPAWRVEARLSLANPQQVAWRPDGNLLAIADGSRVVRLLDRRGTVIDDVKTPAPASSLAWAPDGSLLAAGLTDGTVAEVSLRTASVAHRLRANEDPQAAPLLFLGNSQLLVAQRDGRVRLWDARTGRPAGAPLTAVSGAPMELLPVGAGLVAVRDFGGQTAVVDVHNRVVLGGGPVPRPLRTDLTAVNATGTGLLVSDGWHAEVWPMDLSTWMHRACEVAGRRLTPEEWRAYVPGRTYDASC